MFGCFFCFLNISRTKFANFWWFFEVLYHGFHEFSRAVFSLCLMIFVELPAPKMGESNKYLTGTYLKVCIYSFFFFLGGVMAFFNGFTMYFWMNCFMGHHGFLVFVL